MNNQNLIIKIADSLGVSRSQKELAFKIFINRVTEILNYDEALKIPGLGVFQLKKKAKQKNSKSAAENEGSQIIFSPDYQSETGDKLSLFLTIDVTERSKFSKELSYDSFSLSAGKPVIPVNNSTGKNNDENISDLYIQKSIQERITQMLANSEKLEDFDLWDDFLSRQAKKEPGEKPVDVNKTGIEENSAETDLNGKGSDDDDYRATSFYNEDDEIGKIVLDEKKVAVDEYLEEQHQIALEEPEPPDLLDEVESDLSDRVSSAENIIDEEESIEDILPFENPETQNVTGGDESENDEESNNSGNDLIDELPGKQPETEFTGEDDNNKPAEETINPEEEKSGTKNDDVTNNTADNLEAKAKKNNLTFWISLSSFILLLILGVYYFFFAGNNVNTVKLPGGETATINQSGMSNTSKSFSGKSNGNNAAAKPVEKVTEKKVVDLQKNKTAVKTPEEKVTVENNDKTPANVKKINGEVEVEDLIYFNGKDYALQVSSWRNLDKAKSIADKFNKKGYTASVKSAVVKGKGTWHRVRLVNIKSLTEAKKIKKLVLGN